MTVCITGKMNRGTRANVIDELTNTHGIDVVKSVNYRTTHLIVGDNPGSKLQAAKHRGLSIISEDAFFKTLQ